MLHVVGCVSHFRYMIGLVKFVFHFFPKETTEYMELAEALSHTPAKRVVLDQMCLKSMQAIISTEKIYEVWYPTLHGIPRCSTVSHATRHPARHGIPRDRF